MLLIQSYIDCIVNSPFYQGKNKVMNPLTTRFNLSRPLPIRLDLYIDHILDSLNLPEEILVFSFILIEKYLNKALVSSFNIHSLVFTSISIALKFVLGSWITNKDLEKVGSLKQGSLATMESALLDYLTWKFQFFRFPQVLDYLKNFPFQGNTLENEENYSDGEEVIEIEEVSLADLSELECFFT